jgi:hypothetical protein
MSIFPINKPSTTVYTNMKFAGRWTWCNLCQCPKIRCSECGNISCSGGGCDKCDADFTEAIRMVNADEAPTKEECLAEAIRRDEALVERLETKYDEITDRLEK